MFKIFDGEGEALIQERSSDPEFVSEDGITRWRRGGPIFEQGLPRKLKRNAYDDPIFEQGLLRKLKRDAYDDFEDRSMLNNGIMRSLKRSVWPLRNVHTNGLLRSIRSVENGEDDEQRSYFMEDKQANFNRGL